MGFVTRYTYDKLGNVLTTTDARNNVTYIEYDIMNRVSRVTDALKNENTRIYYDKNGNPTEYYDAYGLIQKITYDRLNRPVAIEDALGNAVKTQYDGIGNVTTETDALNASTYYRYDAMGRLTEFTDSQKGVIQYDYSELGQTKSLTDANGNHTSWVYDLVGNLTYEKNAAGNEKLYEYDKLNRLEFFINGRGERLEYKYDNKDLLTYAAGTFYTHDQNGNILTVYNENGTTKREYDKNDRVTKFTDVNGNAIGYTYDEAGNLIKLTYPAGEVVSYAYDALNRLATVTDYNGRITKYEYDKNSRLVKTTRPDGSIEEITYDRAGRMTAKIDKAANGEIINQYEYTYNTNGDIIEEKDLQGNRTTPIKAESTEMTYGAANRLESVNGQVVSYDADGNMIKGVLGGGEASFGYDKFNRLIRVSAEGTENAENTTVYKYDGEGNRISVTNNGEIIVFVTDPTGSLSNLLESRNIDGSKTIYVYGVGLISQEQVTDRVAGKAAKAAQETTTEYRLFHYDYRGSTTALTNASGNVTDKVVYSPYGKIDERTGETETRFLYVGQFGVQVDKNGLYYMRARYYNVDINRFIQEDSIRDGLNWYAYANNNPIMFVDLWGLEALVVSGGAFNEEEGGNIYQFTFVDSSLLEMSRISSDRTTLLVANAGWTKTQYEAINKYAEDNNINLVWFSNTDELTNYINTKSVSGIGEDRSSDLITSFSVFSHGTDYGTGNYAITFGYGSKTTINLYTDNISQIDPLAFAKNSVSYFYACRTGSTFGITWYGYPYDKENFAQAWANRTNGIVYAIGGINGRSTYADILGKKIEKHLLERLKKGSDSLKKWYTVRGNIFISPGIAYKLPEPVLGGFWYVFSSNSRPEHVPESQLYYQFE